jgi:hypothetical protein
MAHFAQLGSPNIVQQVVVVDNADCINPATGLEEEAYGVQFLERIFGGTWKQTSYNGNIRKKYASTGDLYDESRDAFIPEKPFTSWGLEEGTCQWVAPIDYPSDGAFYTWNEESLVWIHQ